MFTQKSRWYLKVKIQVKIQENLHGWKFVHLFFFWLIVFNLYVRIRAAIWSLDRTSLNFQLLTLSPRTTSGLIPLSPGICRMSKQGFGHTNFSFSNKSSVKTCHFVYFFVWKTLRVSSQRGANCRHVILTEFKFNTNF